jgi:hypothetical protein
MHLKAFFVRKVTDDATSAVRAMFSSAEIKTNSQFISVKLDTYGKEQALMELSARLETDVKWLVYQSVTDAFEYYHWRAGTLLRALVYGCYTDRVWERIEGQPETWERQAFFDPEDLALYLEDDEDESEDNLSAEEKLRLEQFWQAGELVTGEIVPVLGAQRCAFHIAAYYQFPGWES